MELFWKIWLSASGVIVAVAILLVTLVTLQFSREYNRLLGERLLVIGTNAAAHFNSAAELGLPLQSVRNAAVFLDIPRQTDPFISSVRVVDADWDTIAVAGEAAGTGPSVAEIDRAVLENRQGWYHPMKAEFVAGIPIFGLDGSLTGSLLVSYPSGIGRERVLAMLSELSLTSAGFVVAAVLVTGFMLRIWMAAQIAGFRQVEDEIIRFERRVWTLADRHDDTSGPTKDLALSSMMARARRAYLGLVEFLPGGDNPDNDRHK